MRFQVRSLKPGDDSVNLQWLEAESELVLRTQLQSEGLVVLSVSRAVANIPRFRRGSAEQRQRYPLFCREVRTLIQAGMTVVEAVDTLCARERLLGQSDSLAFALLMRLQQGLSLSNALSGLPDAPAVMIAAVRAGERTSNLMAALDDYLRYDILIEQLRRKVVSAAIYPALVATLGVAISLFLLIVVLPSFARMYQNLSSKANGMTAWMIQASQFVSENYEFTLATLALVVLALGWWVTSGAARLFLMAVVRKIPWFKHRVEDFELAMMYQALSLLLKGGYPMTEAMLVAGQAALATQLKTALQQAHAQIERGGSVSQSLSEARLCDEVGRRLMAAAERNGDFYLAADVVSRMHGEQFELFVERMTRIIEPLLLLGVALMVGSIVVAMYLPVFDMATRLR